MNFIKKVEKKFGEFGVLMERYPTRFALFLLALCHLVLTLLWVYLIIEVSVIFLIAPFFGLGFLAMLVHAGENDE
jgi:predicted neutral ceramidase superfamily lipid hydrolase